MFNEYSCFKLKWWLTHVFMVFHRLWHDNRNLEQIWSQMEAKDHPISGKKMIEPPVWVTNSPVFVISEGKPPVANKKPVSKNLPMQDLCKSPLTHYCGVTNDTHRWPSLIPETWKVPLQVTSGYCHWANYTQVSHQCPSRLYPFAMILIEHWIESLWDWVVHVQNFFSRIARQTSLQRI